MINLLCIIPPFSILITLYVIQLLGLESFDIDLAVDNMKGTEFADAFRIHLLQRGVHVSSVGQIKKNPEQSKHLETATFHVDTLSIDCNSLRSDTYADTRIPITVFVTKKSVRHIHQVLHSHISHYFDIKLRSVDSLFMLMGIGVCSFSRWVLQRIGTAYEDAMRRDFTMNALFFNINTYQIEDWSGTVRV